MRGYRLCAAAIGQPLGLSLMWRVLLTGMLVLVAALEGCAAELSAVRYATHVANPNLQRVAADSGMLWTVGSDGAVWRSEDGGARWQYNLSVTPHTLRALAYGPKGERLVGVGEHGSVVMSEDAGGSWQARASTTDQHLLAVVADPIGCSVVTVG